jgi:FixJ family two-component response regulator
MSDKIQLLFVDDEKDFVKYMTKRLVLHDIEVHAFTNPLLALQETEEASFDVGLLDLKMPDMDGEELLGRLKDRDPGMEIIILTGHGSVESAFRSAQRGAYEYLQKPCDFDALVSSINNAYSKRIKALSAEKADQVDALMKQAGAMKPLTLLKRLRNIHRGVSKYWAAAAMAEGGDPESAREIMGGDAKDEERPDESEKDCVRNACWQPLRMGGWGRAQRVPRSAKIWGLDARSSHLDPRHPRESSFIRGTEWRRRG